MKRVTYWNHFLHSSKKLFTDFNSIILFRFGTCKKKPTKSLIFSKNKLGRLSFPKRAVIAFLKRVFGKWLEEGEIWTRREEANNIVFAS